MPRVPLHDDLWYNDPPVKQIDSAESHYRDQNRSKMLTKFTLWANLSRLSRYLRKSCTIRIYRAKKPTERYRKRSRINVN